jgi:hypothetical protein
LVIITPPGRRAHYVRFQDPVLKEQTARLRSATQRWEAKPNRKVNDAENIRMDLQISRDRLPVGTLESPSQNVA